MALLKFKRSAVPAKVPSIVDLDLGELAINTYDGKVYTKKDDGTEAIVEVGGGGGGTVTSVGGTGTVSGLTLTGTVTSAGNLTLGGAITGFLPLTGGTLSGSLIATSFTTASGTNGRVRLQQGTASNTGYVDLLDASGTRLGYMGYGNASYIELSSVGGRYYRFTDTPRVGATAVALTTDLADYLPLTGGNITGNLNASGNVGIGTTSPSQLLTVSGASPFVMVSNTLSSKTTGSNNLVRVTLI